MSKLTNITCISCDKEFETHEGKLIGEVFECPHCGHYHVAEDDCSAEGYVIWFSGNASPMQIKHHLEQTKRVEE